MKYYSLDNLNKTGAVWRLAIGERSNGKSTAVIKYILDAYVKGTPEHPKGTTSAYIRRWSDEIKRRDLEQVFASDYIKNYIKELTGGKYSSVYVYGGKFYLCKYSEDTLKREQDETPFCYAFSISGAEHYKSQAYPETCNIIFYDEFLTRKMSVPNEFIELTNLISTIFRKRTTGVIYMMANTVTKHSEYWEELGINIHQLKQGEINSYTYEDAPFLAVEWCENVEEQDNPSNRYFKAFKTPEMDMILKGKWETAKYPRLSDTDIKINRKDILIKFFITFRDSQTIEGQIIQQENGDRFIYFKKKYSEIKDELNELVYTTDYSPKRNYCRYWNKPTTTLQKFIYNMFLLDKCYYESNSVGETIRAYNMWCNQPRQ